jgi:hypothetical protein
MAHIVPQVTQAPRNRPRRGSVFLSSVAVLFAVVLMPSSLANAQINSIKTVFVVVMSGQKWASIKGNSNAPYINSLLAIGASADNYFSPPGVHVALPNHLWLDDLTPTISP